MDLRSAIQLASFHCRSGTGYVTRPPWWAHAVRNCASDPYTCFLDRGQFDVIDSIVVGEPIRLGDRRRIVGAKHSSLHQRKSVRIAVANQPYLVARVTNQRLAIVRRVARVGLFPHDLERGDWLFGRQTTHIVARQRHATRFALMGGATQPNPSRKIFGRFFTRFEIDTRPQIAAHNLGLFIVLLCC